MIANHFSNVPYVIDDGPDDGPCAGCLNTAGNRAVLVDAINIAGVDNEVTRSFRYRVCARCGTLDRIGDQPAATNLYADDYYSYHEASPTLFERVAIKLRNRHEQSGRGLIGRAISEIWPGPHHRALRPLLNAEFSPRLRPTSRVLDVGCGAGKWLKELRALGYTQLTGVDPFLPDLTGESPVRLLRADVSEIDGTFDVITIHHAFEHIPDGAAALSAMRLKLAPDGVLIVRIPLGASYGWRRFGGYWVQLDPPRHEHLYSVDGMVALAERAGFVMQKVVHDATFYMIAGSEAVVAGMRPHTDQQTASLATQSVFGARRARRVAKLTNRLGTGDQAAFYFTAKSP